MTSKRYEARVAKLLDSMPSIGWQALVVTEAIQQFRKIVWARFPPGSTVPFYFMPLGKPGFQNAEGIVAETQYPETEMPSGGLFVTVQDDLLPLFPDWRKQEIKGVVHVVVGFGNIGHMAQND